MNTEMRAPYFVCVLLFCRVLAEEIVAICDPGTCSSGQYWNRTVCLNCPTGTYQTRENHQCKSCVHCREDNHDLVKVKSCSATEDAKFKCRPGTTEYSNNDLTGLECKPCGECPSGYRKVSDCTEDRDTACEPQSTVSDKVTNDMQQPTEALVEIQSETTRGPDWANTSTIDNKTGSIHIIDNNSSIKYQITTSSNTTADGRNQTKVVIIVTIACVLVLLLLAIGIPFIVWYVRKRRRMALQDNNDVASNLMITLQ